MIVLNLELENIYGFTNFAINFSYPKKVVNSFINDEHLKDRQRFRYKKAVVLMGTNATGKTSLGKVLLKVFTFINNVNPDALYEMVSGDKGTVSIDFVNNGYVLNRLVLEIEPALEDVRVKVYTADIGKMDSYEMCTKKLKDRTGDISSPNAMKKLIGKIEYRFAYPEIENTLLINALNKNVLLKTLRAVVGTLDPTLKEITLSRDLKDTFIIRRKNQEIIIQEGKLLNRAILSSGTVEGIDVAIFLASMMTKENTFYYCDEHFSYIHSDIEKRIFGLMLERIRQNEQLIFTTHNTDMLDLNLPKHSYVFLRKKMEDGEFRVSAISASDLLLKNTDSVRNAVENDVFGSLPDDSLLDELELGWEDER